MASSATGPRPSRKSKTLSRATGWTGRWLIATGRLRCARPLTASPAQDRLWAAPLAGEAPGWPAASLEALQFLHERGVRCVGIDAPTLGGVDQRHALAVHWFTASHGMWPIEFLTGLSQLRDRRAFFLFAPIKLRDSVGGYGRALAVLDEN